MNTTTQHMKLRFRVADQAAFNDVRKYAQDFGLTLTLNVQVKQGWFTETRKNYVTLISRDPKGAAAIERLAAHLGL